MKQAIKSAVIFLFAFLLIGVVLLFGNLAGDRWFSNLGQPQSQNQTTVEEYRCVWFSYLDLSELLKGKTKQQFTQNICEAFDFCKQLGLNRVILQVRPFSDALYRSKIFPTSQFYNGVQGAEMEFDPLEIMVTEAKKRGLAVDAWVNPYRICLGKEQYPCQSNPALSTISEDSVVAFKNGLYYNPASQQVQQLIIDGICEILDNYNVDGIHFDDYFYPSGIDDSFDDTAYQQYVSSGGTQNRTAWRMQNVNDLIKKVYEQTHRRGKVFTVSPQGNVSNCERLFADVRTWCQQPGYVDIIMPQLYWGYHHTLETAQFQNKINEWSELVTNKQVKLVFGLGAYRIGDQSGGFTTNGDDLAKMVADGRNTKHYAGFSLYRYKSLIGTDQLIQTEINHLKQMLK